MKKISILLAGVIFSFGFGQNFSSVRDVVGSAQPNVEIQPDGTNEDCSIETLSNNFENGLGPITTYQWANDFEVEPGTTFAVNQLKFNVLLDAGATVDAAEIYFYTDSGYGPGDLVGTSDFVVPTSVEVVGSLSSLDVVEVVADFNAIELSGGATYWVGLQVYSDAESNYWEVTSILNSMEEMWVLDGDTWAPISSLIDVDPSDGVFTLSGDCTTMGVSDVNATSLSVYPNPATNVVNVSLKNSEVKEVAVTNLSGQVVATSKTANVNIAALPAGVYVVKVTDAKGAVRTSKIVVK